MGTLRSIDDLQLADLVKPADLAALEPLYVRMPRGVAAASVERIQWL